MSDTDTKLDPQDIFPDPSAEAPPKAEDASADPETPEVDTDDAVLDALMEGSTPESLEDDAPEPKESPPAEEPEAGDPPADDAQSPPPEGDEPPEEEAPAVEPEGYQRALEVLSRDNVPTGVITGMDPAEVIAWAGRREAAHKEIDTAYGQRAEFQERILSMPEDPAGDAEDQIGHDFITESLKPMADDELFEDMVEPVAKVATALHEKIAEVELSTSEIAAMRDQTISFLVNRIEDLEITNARNDLREQFPQLDDKAKLETVREQMSKLSRATDDAGQQLYGTMTELMEAASVQAFHGDIVQQHQASQSRRVKAKEQGQPSVDTSADTLPPPPTPDDEEDSALDRILDERRGRARMPA